LLKSIALKSLRASFLSATLMVLPPVAAQQAAPPAPEAPFLAPAVRSLRVIALAGNDEQNDLERGLMAPLVVQVLDQDGRPVEGAEVVFRFPLTGPSATFPNQKNSRAFRTNADGQAAALGWKANSETGTFEVRVTATRGNELGETTVRMTNVARVVAEPRKERKRWWSSRWFKIGVVAAVAGSVTGIVLATRNGSSTASPPITIGTGPITIGGPR
jgi:hypothetical protein